MAIPGAAERGRGLIASRPLMAAMLEHSVTGVRHPLTVRTLVGRSHACQLRLSRPQVSGIHAEVAWDGERWVVRDLGSRNGTTLDGQRLTAEQRLALKAGSQIAFGTEDERFVLVDASPPGLVVVGDDGTILSAEAGLLPLPSEAQPEVVLVEQRELGWQLETETRTRPVVDRETIDAGGVRWSVHLPGRVMLTDDGRDTPMSIGSLTLEFRVSRDEEHVELEASQGSRVVTLKPRAHDFFLLTLARARLADQARADLDPTEYGWVHRQDLAHQLKVDRSLINLWVYRARRQFALAGIVDVADLIERRRGAEQLRIGIGQLRVSGT